MSKSNTIKYGLKNQHIIAIQNIFKMHPKVTQVILYGSRAKGNYRPASDLDLTLKGENLNYNDLVAIDNALDDLLLPYTIDLSIYEQIENPDLIDHIKRVGQEFYTS